MSSLKEKIVHDASQCVACGLCLPHCPTYRLLKSEADSPRGRIMMMHGVASGRIPANERFIEHMNRCLACRACETVCPNQVAYGDLIDQTRALVKQQSMPKKRASLLMWLLMRLLRQPNRLVLLRPLLRFMQRQQWLRYFGRLFGSSLPQLLRFVMQLPLVQYPAMKFDRKNQSIGNNWQAVYPALGSERGKIGLFLGCIARLTDVETLNSSIYILNRLGYTVFVPSAQTCCGAIDQHSGALSQADQLAMMNKAAFSALGIDTIISTSSGCGVQLLESGSMGESMKLMDISQFLVTAECWNGVEITPLCQTVLVHEPCTLRNVLRGQQYVYSLMQKIPDAQVVSLSSNDQCCGAAGIYFIEQPELANQLLDSKLLEAKECAASYLVTSNIGCAMHIANGLCERGVLTRVVHPVSLLARQMGYGITIGERDMKIGAGK